MVRVKICGVTREEDLNAVIQAGADAVGFVVDVEASPRNISFDEARELIVELPNNMDSVAVTVFKRPQRIMKILRELTPTFIQLHGITCEQLDENNQLSRDRTIVAIDATSNEALQRARSFSRCVDSILVDTNQSEGLGGTGRVHNWNKSRYIRDAIRPTHVILAGGLTCENVGRAIRSVRPYGVDVSTGVEARPGIKDPAKINAFVKEAKETVF